MQQAKMFANLTWECPIDHLCCLLLPEPTANKSIKSHARPRSDRESPLIPQTSHEVPRRPGPRGRGFRKNIESSAKDDGFCNVSVFSGRPQPAQASGGPPRAVPPPLRGPPPRQAAHLHLQDRGRPGGHTTQLPLHRPAHHR